MNARTLALAKQVERGAYMHRAHSKGEAAEYYKAKRNKKKLPSFKRKVPKVNKEYKKMSIAEYEAKYPD